nr:Dihydrofolate reductase [uncultured bacterium]
MTMISLVAALSANRVIGKDNAMPWHIPEELQLFKSITMGKPIIMGRKTFDAIGRRLLPGRSTIVLTQDQNLHGAGFEIAHSVEEALRLAGDVPEVMVVGGAGIYAQFLPLAHRMYLSFIPQQYDGDAFFPEFAAEEWRKVSEQEHGKFTAVVLEHIQ